MGTIYETLQCSVMSEWAFLWLGMYLVAIARQASLIEHRDPLETGKVLCEYSLYSLVHVETQRWM